MFSFRTKSPEKKLQAKYNELLEEAMLYQRKGDINSYSKLTEEADKVLKKIDALSAKP